ncbi:MAG: 3-dehydroquinate synthase [Pyrinomonadaceae bacterium]|nr:3-dehydroquinate synthase [Pyrinomonadaceae bacterium]
MEKHASRIAVNSGSHQYTVEIGHGILESAGAWLSNSHSQKDGSVSIISNKKVFDLYGATVEQSLTAAGFKTSKFLMEDGEEYKNFESFLQALEFLGEKGTRRTDAVLALGGGVVGDLAGFAASVYLRGVPFLSIPTTFLSMIDASVGGKTAVNTSFGKNTVGTFHQPKGVLIDVKTLATLDERELLAGFFEAIKHGAVGGPGILTSIEGFLSDFPVNGFSGRFNNSEFVGRLEKVVFEQVAFKAEIVSGDEKEDTSRNDAKSRKILNFGHTVGHSLEKVTNYRYFKHGEAVAYGMLAAAEISKRLDILDKNSLNLLKRVVSTARTLPDARSIEIQEIINSFSSDKKLLSEELQWVLLGGIGKPKIVSSLEIPEPIIFESLQDVLHR